MLNVENKKVALDWGGLTLHLSMRASHKCVSSAKTSVGQFDDVPKDRRRDKHRPCVVHWPDGLYP